VDGTARPSAFAVLRLMTSSNLVGFDRKINRFGALQDLTHIGGRAPEEVGEARAVGHQAPVVRELAKATHGREAAAGGQQADQRIRAGKSE
jgi:hypothetical protein